jgi:hypothetical protein
MSTLATAKPRAEPEAEAEADSEHFDTFGTLHTESWKTKKKSEFEFYRFRLLYHLIASKFLIGVSHCAFHPTGLCKTLFF